MATIPAGWTETTQGLVKTYSWKDFAQALAFVVEAGKIAKAMNHHPDVEIRWNKVTLTVMTHSAGKITQLDFELAEKIERISRETVITVSQTLL